jgi:hypothetical protein
MSSTIFPSSLGLLAAYIRTRPVLLVAISGSVALSFIAGDALATPVLIALGVSQAMLVPSVSALGVGYVLAALRLGQFGTRLPVLLVLGLAMLGLATLFVVHGAAVALGSSLTLVTLSVAFPARLLFGMCYGSTQVASAYAVHQ